MGRKLKPPSIPAVGTFWRRKSDSPPITDKYEDWLSVVAVVDVKGGYARMGVRADVVEYTSGLAYACHDTKNQGTYERTMAHTSFLEYFTEIENLEELSEEFALAALKHYA